MWRARSIEVARAQGIDDFEPSYLKLANAGDRNAVVEVTGESSRSLGPLGSVALDANTGELLATQLPGWRDANHATLAATYALHFGEYGNALVPWRSEEHTSELQSIMRISYAVFCLKKKKQTN